MNAVQREELTLQLDGALVQEYTLKNANAQIKISSFGATLLSFTIQCPGFPSRDVVLGYKDFESYRKAFEQSGNAYFGAIVGPIAGRISNAKIPWKAGVFEFEPNEGKHLLHSGNKCFSNSNWELVSLQEKPYPSVTLALETKSSGIALPGNLRCEATYRLKDFTLELHIESIALEDTLANPTQHSYFNPNGHQASVLNSEAWIAADSFLNLNQEKLPTGGLFPLFVDSSSSSTPFFPLQTIFEGLDHAFLLNVKEAQAKLIAADGFELRFNTNQPVIQVYVGGAVAFEGKEGAKYHRHSGICLEQQAEPDAPNQLNFSDIYLSKGQRKTNTMEINFEQSK